MSTTPPTIQSTIKDPEFLKLAPDDQVAVLKHLHEDAATTPAPAAKPDSVIGGFGRRAVDAAKGVAATFDPRTSGTAEEVASAVGGPGGLALERAAKGAYEGYKAKAGELAGDIADKRYGKAALHGAELLEPSIGPASPTGSLIDEAAEGRWREALGGAAFDATTTLLGGALGKTPGTASRVAKLTAATGKMAEGAGETISHILPELDRTAQVVGKPSSVGDYESLVQKTMDRHEATFNQSLQPLANQLVNTAPVRQRILGLIKPDSPPEEVAAIRKAADEYLTPKTMNWLNARRMRLNAATNTVWSKDSGAAAAAMRSDLDLAIDKATRDAVASQLYDVLDRANPGADFRELKAQQKSLWALKDQLDTRIKDLTDKELTAKGRTLREKYSPHGYVGRHVGAYVSGSPAESHPLAAANTKVRQAAGTSGPRNAAAAAVLSAPIARLAAKDDDKRRSSVPPPPSAP
jgi:hypothetical protein